MSSPQHGADLLMLALLSLLSIVLLVCRVRPCSALVLNEGDVHVSTKGAVATRTDGTTNGWRCKMLYYSFCTCVCGGRSLRVRLSLPHCPALNWPGTSG